MQIINEQTYYGSTYCLVRWIAPGGMQNECWIPEEGLSVNRKAHTMKKVLTEECLSTDQELQSLSMSCNTSKEKKMVKSKIAGVNILVFPCGHILGVQELFGSESLTQVLLPLYELMKMPGMIDDVKVFIHDNACRFGAFMRNRKSKSPLMEKLAGMDMRVDRHHFRNHVGKECRSLHDPDKCAFLDGVNTSRMEQVMLFPDIFYIFKMIN